MRPEIHPTWIDYFRRNGFPSAAGLAAGMEGAVYSLVPGELVAKVWYRRGEADLMLIKEFYEAIEAPSGGIATPRIVEIRIIDGALVSFERFLPGVPLQSHLLEDARHADRRAVLATVRVLAFLASVPPQGPLRRLSVLDEAVSPWEGASSWSEALRTLLSLRLRRFRLALSREIPEVDGIVAGVDAFLSTRDDVRLGLLHGDLCGVNIMVDDKSLNPTAVFDFGFLSTVGDPAFDASISSAIFNMYGPHARTIDEEVTEMIAHELGHPRKVLLAYRAVYALLTSNAYSPEGTDGHFRWCIEMLRRHDVRQALDL